MTIVKSALMYLLLLAPAQAVTMQAVYTGTVQYTLDTGNIFGGNGASLDGRAFTLTTVYDTALGLTGPDLSNLIPGGATTLRGGSASGYSDPYLSAMLTINGATYSFAPAKSDSVTIGTLGNGFRQSYDASPGYNPATGISTTIRFGTLIADGIGALPSALTTPFSWTRGVPGQSFGSGDFTISSYDTTSGRYLSYAEGYLSLSGLTVTALQPATVPLPASAAMLLAALGGVVATGWRRRGARQGA